MAASLTTIRQLMGAELGRYQQGTANSTGNTTLTLVDDQLVSSLSLEDFGKDCFLCLPAKSGDDRVSRIIASFAPSTGTITVDRAWSASTVPDSAVYEIHGVVEPITDLQACVNQALKRILLVDEFTVTPTANAIRHDLTTANAWLTDPLWIRQVGYLVSGESRAEVDPFRNRAVRGYPSVEAGIVYLNHGPRTFAANETIYVRCLRPAYSNCRTSSGDAYGTQTTGLTAEAHETEVEAEAVVAGAINHALRRNLLAVDPESNGRLLATVKQSAALWSRWCRIYDSRARVDGKSTFAPVPIPFGANYSVYR